MPEPDAASPRPLRVLLIAAGIAAVALVTFEPALSNGFVDFDDPLYVTGNPMVRRGLDAEPVRWALTANVASNWHPLTLWSHMADVALFGLDPRGHHLTSVALHAANAVLLFLVLMAMTGSTGPSALVAALFAVHPTHVESVAWIAERKDVLSTLFWLLATAAYLAYARRPSVGRYLVTAVLLALGLAAKPMLVTLPLVFLLLDAWPLGRLAARWRTGRWRAVAALAAEKVPLLALSAAAGWVAVVTQGEALAEVSARPLGARAANAAVAYVAYVGDTLWPRELAALYPFPAELAAWRVAGAVVLLLAATAGAAVLWRRAPYLLVGWLWFLGTLVPVIGILAVGGQARADRYTYVPAIGLYLMAAWGGAALLRERPRLRVPAAMLSVAAIAVLAVAARAQIATWRDSETLFRRALAVTEGNDIAHRNLAEVLRAQGRADDALTHYRQAIAIEPEHPAHHAAFGSALDALGRRAEAVAHFERALALDNDQPRFHLALAQALDNLGRVDRAIAHLERALALDPGSARAHHGLGALHDRAGDAERAIVHYRAALDLDPSLPLRGRIAALLARAGSPGDG